MSTNRQLAPRDLRRGRSSLARTPRPSIITCTRRQNALRNQRMQDVVNAMPSLRMQQFVTQPRQHPCIVCGEDFLTGEMIYVHRPCRRPMHPDCFHGTIVDDIVNREPSILCPFNDAPIPLTFLPAPFIPQGYPIVGAFPHPLPPNPPAMVTQPPGPTVVAGPLNAANPILPGLGFVGAPVHGNTNAPPASTNTPAPTGNGAGNP